jgi:tetrahydromethanopterin S-methyltransferase subunit F
MCSIDHLGCLISTSAVPEIEQIPHTVEQTRRQLALLSRVEDLLWIDCHHYPDDQAPV